MGFHCLAYLLQLGSGQGHWGLCYVMGAACNCRAGVRVVYGLCPCLFLGGGEGGVTYMSASSTGSLLDLGQVLAAVIIIIII